jgi:hypothetical protein
MRTRKAIPEDTEHRVLDRSRRRCALCVHLDNDYGQKEGQIAHIDRDPSNADEDNLVYLCLPHHDDYDTKRRQTKNLTVREVKTARDRLYTFIASGGDLATAGRRPARRQADERRLSVIKRAVRVEARRLEIAVSALRRALPSAPQPAARFREQLVVESSPLLRGEREEISLLDDQTRGVLEELAGILDEYNARIETAVVVGQGPLIDQEILALVDRLAEVVQKIHSIL